MLFWLGKQNNTPHADISNQHNKSNRLDSSQSGNVLALLFGAVVMTGVVAATSMEVVVGPVQTITRVTQKNMADEQMTTNAKLVVLEAATHSNNRDSDSDGFVEPIEYVPNGASGCSITFTGGGCLPDSMGATMNDPFGRPFAYCVWDHGSVDNGHGDTSPSSPYRLQGTNSQSNPVIALISAGRDQEFQTRCAAYDGSGDEGVVKPVGSDDWVFTYTYTQATAASSGLWQLKSGTPDTAEISKNLEVMNASNAVTVTIGRDTGVGDFLGVTTDLITAKTAGSITADVNTLTIDGALFIGADGTSSDGAIEITSDNDAFSYIDFKGNGNEASDFIGRIGHDDNNGFNFGVNSGSSTGLSILNDDDVVVGTNTPHASAILDVTATNQGFLPPRMNTSQRNSISSPATGLLIYNSQELALQIFDGTNWIDVGTTLWELAGSSDAVYTAGSAGVGATTVNAGAAFELTSTSKGFLPPRMNETQRDNIASPAEGLIVYNSDTQMPEFWDGSKWVCMAGGSGASSLPTGLYSFTSHRFTNCGQTGRTGPSLSTCRSSYSTSWDSNNSYFTMSTNGIQIWTVPATGTYRITAAGAAGGAGQNSLSTRANGAVVTGEFNLNQGEQIRILVGQMGGDGSGDPHGNEKGGGGGTFVVRGTSGTSNPLIIAGGGGGAPATSYGTSCSRNINTGHGQAGSSTASYTCNSTVSSYSDGNGGRTSGSNIGAGGGGLNGNGSNGGGHCQTAIGGTSFSSGGTGATGGGCYMSNNWGGFGGGGRGSLGAPGGGGGHTGGSVYGSWSSYSTYGGGGSSYNSGSNQTAQSGTNSSHGYVDIQLLPTVTSRCGSSSLFEFTSHTFSNCGQTGRTGPSLSQCRSAYSTSWDANSSFFDMSTNGIQEWTVPETATYRITAAGARGGYNNSNYRGAQMRGDFNLTEGEKLYILVGQYGTGNGSYYGGGGGTFVAKGTTLSNTTALIVAGGGGGADTRYNNSSSHSQGTTSQNGQNSNTGGCSTTHSGGSSGNGGQGSSNDGGGGGFTGNGTSGGPFGYAFKNGGIGGNDSNGDGGFGGGGGTSNDSGGGGGGYSGGASCGENGNGAGGGSYNSGSNPSNSTGVNSNHGSVTIQKL